MILTKSEKTLKKDLFKLFTTTLRVIKAIDFCYLLKFAAIVFLYLTYILYYKFFKKSKKIFLLWQEHRESNPNDF